MLWVLFKRPAIFRIVWCCKHGGAIIFPLIYKIKDGYLLKEYSAAWSQYFQFDKDAATKYFFGMEGSFLRTYFEFLKLFSYFLRSEVLHWMELIIFADCRVK